MDLRFFRTLTACAVLILSNQAVVAREHDNSVEHQSALAALDAGDFEVAVQILTPLADAGDAWAMNALAGLYLRGLGVESNTSKGVGLLSEAAKLGNANAQYNMGVFHLDGLGVPADERAAARFFLEAAKQGFAAAQFEMGNILASGRFEGDPARIAILGKRKVDSTAVPDDDVAAAEWYRKAATQGHAGAQYNLGWMYNDGRGVPQNFAEAYKLYREAASQGLTSAQSHLALLYARGEGAPKNLTLAYMWSLVAAASGDEVALHNREIIADGLSEQERAIAQTKAKACVDSGFTDCN